MKNFLYAIGVNLLISICLWAETTEKSILGENAFLQTAKYKIIDADKSSFNEKGTILKVDTTQSKDVWHKILEFSPNMFEVGKNYSIEMRYKVLEGDEDALIFFIVRDQAKNAKGIISDAAGGGYKNDSGKYKTVRMFFKAGENAKDLALVIHAHKKIKAKVRDIKIYNGFVSSTMIAPESKPEKFEGDYGKLPTGCADFEVQLPNPAKDAVVLNAADFGVSEKSDGAQNFKNLRKAIEEAKKLKAAKLVLNKGIYKIFNDENSEPIRFEELKDFTFDGCGSTIVFRKKNGSLFYIVKNERIKLENFNVDWDWDSSPIISIVEVLDSGKSENGENFVTIKFCDYAKFPDRTPRTAIFCNYNPENLERLPNWGMCIALGAGKEKGLTKEWLSDNVLKLTGPQIRPVEKGGKKFLQHYYYDRNAFDLFSNNHLTLQNINVYSCPGHAFLVGGTQKYFQFINTNIVLRPDVKRPKITCSADHLHFSRSCGFFKMIGCEFSFGVDDCGNFHDCSGFARRHTDFSVMTQNTEGFPKGTKVELRHGDYSPTKYIGTVKQTIPVNPAKRVYEVVFEEKLPAQKSDGFIMFNTTFDTHNILIKDCYFHDTVCRGLLILARDMTVENCRFERHNMGALKFETGYTFDVWSEGYGVNNIVIRNNTFTDSNICEHKHGGWARDIFMGVYMKVDPTDVGTNYPIISNILIENNTFNETTGLIAYITSTGNVTIRDNTFINRKPSPSNFAYRGGFYIGYSNNTKIVNNKWLKSEYTPNIGVFYDDATTKRITVQGNQVIQDK